MILELHTTQFNDLKVGHLAKVFGTDATLQWVNEHTLEVVRTGTVQARLIARHPQDIEQRIRQMCLTGKQERVLRLITEGLNNQEISQILEMGEKGVAKHITQILQKMSLTRRSDILCWYIKCMAEVEKQEPKSFGQ